MLLLLAVVVKKVESNVTAALLGEQTARVRAQTELQTGSGSGIAYFGRSLCPNELRLEYIKNAYILVDTRM
jgi:hypothetical protein